MLYALGASFILLSASVSRLMQAFSLPFLGAIVLAVALAILVRRE